MGGFQSKKYANDFSYIYDVKKDPEDSRDFLMKVGVSDRNVFPASVDLRANCPPVYNQGTLGSCTANAIAFAYEYIEHASVFQEGVLNDMGLFSPCCVNPKKWFCPSRLFVYFNERSIEHTIPSDSGANLRDGFKSLRSTGVCSEESWPYVIEKFEEKPPSNCYTEALLHRVKVYKRVLPEKAALMSCLRDGTPIVFGLKVYKSFENTDASGRVDTPDYDPDKELGGHALAIVGYVSTNPGSTTWIVRNSWGTGWGDNGYCYIESSYLLDPHFSMDFWCIETETNEDPDLCEGPGIQSNPSTPETSDIQEIDPVTPEQVVDDPVTPEQVVGDPVTPETPVRRAHAPDSPY